MLTPREKELIIEALEHYQDYLQNDSELYPISLEVEATASKVEKTL